MAGNGHGSVHASRIDDLDVFKVSKPANESVDRQHTSAVNINGNSMNGQSHGSEETSGCVTDGRTVNGESTKGHAVYSSHANFKGTNGHTPNENLNGQFGDGHLANGNSVIGYSTDGDPLDRHSININSINGHPVNGHPVNGHPINGHSVNGHSIIGDAVNGHSINGHSVNGDAVNSHSVNNHSANGHSINGRSVDVHSVNGHSIKQNPVSDATINGIESNGQLPIAICGMGFRLPAGLATPEQLWDFLIAKGDARSRVPESRYNVSAFHDPAERAGTTTTEYGYFLDQDLGMLDTSFFSMPKTEVERADPQQRLMLEVTREALEDAGETDWRGKAIGCYMGSFGEDWCEIASRDTQSWGVYRITGYGDFAMPNRVSYELDLKGPSMIVRTACSSSLVALHEACTALVRGDCESALVGGANLIMNTHMTINASAQHILSPDGSCKSFSADANGYARGEAITAVFIKPLDAAIRDGNPIRAVIRGTASNHDGKTPGFTVPSIDVQEAMMRRAYKVAGITDYSKTAYVECHGTGTPTGDPIETKAVARVFGDAGTYIGSVKPNLGHTEGSSGILSLIKTVLALQHRTIPPNIRFTKPNPAIPFESAKLVVPTEPTAWPADRLERASINSFGIGGTNAHVIIDSAASYCAPTATKQMLTPNDLQLLLFSANSQNALNTIIENYRSYTDSHPDRIGDLAYTLANKREHLSHRAFAIAESGRITTVSPISKTGKPPVIVMIFTGQGAQWPQMGLDLLNSNKMFLRSIQALDQCLQGLSKAAPEWSIEAELRKPGKRSRVNKAEYSQPLCTAIQIALVDTLAYLGIQPEAVVGHSSGEIAAAYAAGALSKEEAILAAMHRGSVTQSQKSSGAMAAIGMSWEETEKYLVPGVVIACENSPKSVTISGDTEKVEEVLGAIQSSLPSVLAKKLQVDKAYHSHHMAEIGEEYHSLIRGGLSVREPTTLFFSSVTGKLLDQSVRLDSRYWQKNLESPVRFSGAVSGVIRHLKNQKLLFLEIGPHSALAGPLRQIMTEESSTATYVSAMVRNRSCTESLLSAAGKLYAAQVSLDLNALIPHGSCLSDLPRYPWDHNESYWHESRLSKEYRQRKYRHHQLLGSRVLESTDFEPSWRNVFHLDSAPWVRDHKIEDDVVFPFAGYIAMAGEAIRQLTDIEQTFRLRHVIVSTALVVRDAKPTEMVTTLRAHRLTDTLNSDWWEFTVSSHNGQTWTKHCSGQVKAEDNDLETAQKSENFPRKVDTRTWFDSLRRTGLDLGPAFCNIGDISVSTSAQEAKGTLYNRRHPDMEEFHLHPTIVDGVLQLMIMSCAQGQTRKHKKRLPVSCDEIFVSRSHDDLVAAVTTRPFGSSAFGEGNCVVNSNSVLKFSGMKFALVDKSESSEIRQQHAAARLQWGPDIDFVDTKDLFCHSIDLSLYVSRLDDLFHLCLLDSQRSLAGLIPEKPHLQRFYRWINEQPNSFGSSLRAKMDEQTIRSQIIEIVSSLKGTPVASAAAALQAVCHNIGAIISSQVPSWEALLTDTSVRELHELMSKTDISSFIGRLAHYKPSLKVLEIGTWSSSPSNRIIQDLTSPNGQPLYSKYTFTSQGYISAQDHSVKSPNIEYVTLDINEDPLEQGFEPHKYDLVIASNVLHTTRNVSNSLHNIRKLVHPTGRLLLQEPCPTSKWANYIFGTHPRWWVGITDNRTEEPYLSVDQLQHELANAGFERPDAVVLDAEEPFQLGCTMVVHPSRNQARQKRVSLLCRESASIPDLILLEFERQGYQLERCTLADRVPPGQDVLCILDRDGPFFENINSNDFQLFKTFVSKLENSGVFWITLLSQMHVQDPRYAQAIGTARTMRTEMLVDFATCEVEKFDVSAFLLCKVFTKYWMRDADDSLNPDMEYAIYKDVVYVGRFYPFTLSNDLTVTHPSDKLALDVGVPGRPTTLHWVRKPNPRNLQPHEVEVEMFSVGLNFRDILITMDIVELEERVLGAEGAGIVRRVGSDVKTLNAGDRVAALGRGMFSTIVITTETCCAKLPDGLGFDEASTMFVPYLTAMISLMDIGGLKKGQSVLIHSAAGGVGLAAIQLAQMLEADLYATVGTEDKVQHLMKACNIPRGRIFNSRDNSFVKGIMQETQGKGVDLVLNSLSGELLHATWSCVAPFGKMVEIGKRDLIGYGKLEMNSFLANRTYSCVDVDAYIVAKPDALKRSIDSVTELYQKGAISPVYPLKMFSAAQPYEAFRYMQPGQHIGRIGIALRDPSKNQSLIRDSISRAKTLTLNGEASYLLIGGLGGLGRAISTWMVENGARHLIYLSRSAGLGSDDHTFASELESMGCQIQLVRGSVTNQEDITRAVKAATHPVKGILQMSMVLQDESFPNMSLEQWNAATSVKVQGTWNLHNVTTAEDLDLEFFVLFSSLSGTIGQPGQASYASANTFLDAFVQYRTNLGLPASAIDIGAVGDVGVVARNIGLMQKMDSMGYKSLTEQEVLDALQVAMEAAKPQPKEPTDHFVDPNNFVLGLHSTVPLSSPASRAVYKRDRRMAIYHNASSGENAGVAALDSSLKSYIAAARADPSVLKTKEAWEFFAVEIGRSLFKLLLKPEEDLNTSLSLTDLGMDSLVGIELRKWWKQVFGIDISMLEMLGKGTLEALGQHAAEELLASIVEQEKEI